MQIHESTQYPSIRLLNPFSPQPNFSLIPQLCPKISEIGKLVGSLRWAEIRGMQQAAAQSQML